MKKYALLCMIMFVGSAMAMMTHQWEEVDHGYQSRSEEEAPDIWHATREGDVNLVKGLIASGADVNAVEPQHRLLSSLHEQ